MIRMKGEEDEEGNRLDSFRLKELHSSLPVQMFPSPTLFEVNQDKGVIEERVNAKTRQRSIKKEGERESKDCRSREEEEEAQSVPDDRQENQRMRSKNSCR